MKLLPRAPILVLTAMALFSAVLALFGATEEDVTKDKRLHLNMHCYNPMTKAEWDRFKAALANSNATSYSVDYVDSPSAKPDHQGKGQVSGSCDCGGKKPNQYVTQQVSFLSGGDMASFLKNAF